VSAHGHGSRGGAPGARQTVLLVLLLGGLAGCSYDQHLGESNCAANPRIELVWSRNSPSSASTPWGDFTSLASDGTNVYFGVLGRPEQSGVWQASISGGDPMRLAPGWANGVAVDATSVYWWHSEGVTSIPIGGGTPSPIAEGQRAGSIALDATNVYWTNATDGTVMKVPKGGGAATVLASGQSQPTAIAVDADNVYWHGTDGTIKKVPIGGGDETLLVSGVGWGGMAVADKHLYWTNGSNVMKVPTDGGSLTTLASGQWGPRAIAADGTNVYFEAGGNVRRVPVGGGAPVTIECWHSAGLMALGPDHVYWFNDEGIVRYPR
jgi:hypothetical protein